MWELLSKESLGKIDLFVVQPSSITQVLFVILCKQNSIQVFDPKSHSSTLHFLCGCLGSSNGCSTGLLFSGSVLVEDNVSRPESTASRRSF